MTFRRELGEGLVSAWNAAVPVGTPCYLVNDDGQISVTETTSEAWCLGHGQPVVKVKGKSGGYLLERIIPQRKRPAADPFDRVGNLTLTTEQVDELLERFDQTPEPLQRQIIAAFVSQLSVAKELLSGVNTALTPGLRDRIEQFLS